MHENKLIFLHNSKKKSREIFTDTIKAGKFCPFFLGHKNVVEFLINKGANIESKNSYGSTALSLAAVNGICINLLWETKYRKQCLLNNTNFHLNFQPSRSEGSYSQDYFTNL